MIEPLPDKSPGRGEIPIEAVVFDTFGTVCDFYQPIKHAFEALARRMGVECDAGRMAIEWRTAYVVSTLTQAVNESEFRPLRDINRDNLVEVPEKQFPCSLTGSEISTLNGIWEKLDPWPDAVAGLHAIKRLAIIAPLSNGNFADMVRLSRYGGNLPGGSLDLPCPRFPRSCRPDAEGPFRALRLTVLACQLLQVLTS